MLWKPVEIKANYPWKEVHKLFTAPSGRAQGTHAERQGEACSPGADGNGRAVSPLGFSGRKVHVVSSSAAERDRCTRSISLSRPVSEAYCYLAGHF